MSGQVFEYLVASTLLMALVLLARPLTRRWCGSGGAYSLWLIPMLLPAMALFPDEAPVLTLFQGAAPVDLVLTNVARADAGLEWLVWPWAVGALLFAGWQLVAYRRFLGRALAGAERLNASGTPVFATDAVDGPAAAGLHDWRIFVPRDFEARFTPTERKLALRHELRHLSAAHLHANAAALVMLALHWFNPLAWRAYRAFRVDQELSCDEAVVATCEAEERAAYATAMIKAAARGGRTLPATACPMARNRTLKRRLSMIKTHRTFRQPLARTIAAYALVTVAGVMLTATGGIAAEPVKTIKNIRVKRVHGTDPAQVAGVLEEVLSDPRCGEKTKRFQTETVASGVDGKTKGRVIFCSSSSETAFKTPADRIATLEGVRGGLLTADMEPAERTRAIESIDALIAKMKAEK